MGGRVNCRWFRSPATILVEPNTRGFVKTAPKPWQRPAPQTRITPRARQLRDMIFQAGISESRSARCGIDADSRGYDERNFRNDKLKDLSFDYLIANPPIRM